MQKARVVQSPGSCSTVAGRLAHVCACPVRPMRAIKSAQPPALMTACTACTAQAAASTGLGQVAARQHEAQRVQRGQLGARLL